jgi:hypothetical protein
MMKMRQRRRLLYRRILIGIRIRELIATLDALTEEVLHSETELIQMELPSPVVAKRNWHQTTEAAYHGNPSPT